MEDSFIHERIKHLLRNIGTHVFIKLIKPYTQIDIPFISKELNIMPQYVESLLVSCILDHIVNGWIHHVNKVLELVRGTTSVAQ